MSAEHLEQGPTVELPGATGVLMYAITDISQMTGETELLQGSKRNAVLCLIHHLREFDLVYSPNMLIQ